jgi:hypothetical protein
MKQARLEGLFEQGGPFLQLTKWQVDVLSREMTPRDPLPSFVQFYHNKRDRQLVAAMTSRAHDNRTINHAVITTLCKLQRVGRINVGYVVFCDPQFETIFAQDTALNIHQKVKDHEPRNGKRGPYYLFDSKFNFIADNLTLPF